MLYVVMHIGPACAPPGVGDMASPIFLCFNVCLAWRVCVCAEGSGGLQTIYYFDLFDVVIALMTDMGPFFVVFLSVHLLGGRPCYLVTTGIDRIWWAVRTYGGTWW